MLCELFAEVIFVAKTEVVRNLLDGDFFKTVKIGHSFLDLEFQYVLMDRFSESRLEFRFSCFLQIRSPYAPIRCC